MAEKSDHDAASDAHENPATGEAPADAASHPNSHRASARARPEALSLVIEFFKMSRTTAVLLIVFVLTAALYMLVRQDPSWRLTLRPDLTRRKPSPPGRAPPARTSPAQRSRPRQISRQALPSRPRRRRPPAPVARRCHCPGSGAETTRRRGPMVIGPSRVPGCSRRRPASRPSNPNSSSRLRSRSRRGCNSLSVGRRISPTEDGM